MDDFLVSLVGATLRVATPLIFATLGELFCERAGILNLGIEGIMFLGAFAGFTAASLTGSLWLGLIGAIISGMLAGLLLSLFAVRLGVNQHVSGLGITLLATALSLFLFRVIFKENQNLPSVVPFQQLEIFTNNPILHEIFSQYLLTYIAIAIIPVVWFIIFRTNYGLKIRSVGDNPEATDAAGINVYRLRTSALVIGGALMAIGGAFLSIAQLGKFTFRHHRGERLGMHCPHHLWQLAADQSIMGGITLWWSASPAIQASDHRDQTALRTLPGTSLHRHDPGLNLGWKERFISGSITQAVQKRITRTKA